ncbi:MAG: hypothetical protein ABW022_06450 [Actinoplanes sp.]
MSFASIATCVNDDPFGQRTRAAYAKEGVDQPDPAWYQQRWAIAADPSVEAPYESALIAGNPNPGGDPAVVTDGMLTAAVQAHPYEPPPVP